MNKTKQRIHVGALRPMRPFPKFDNFAMWPSLLHAKHDIRWSTVAKQCWPSCELLRKQHHLEQELKGEQFVTSFWLHLKVFARSRV